MCKFSLVALFYIFFACYSNASPHSRIVGGENGKEQQFPYQVSLRADGSHFCGGSIISNSFILTAAHCVYENRFHPSIFTVRAGSIDRFKGGVLMKVANIIVHDAYRGVLNDVALVQLTKPIIFSESIQPIRLASSEVPAKAKVIISGWGRVKQSGDIPQKLKWNELTVITRKECNDQIKVDTEVIVCLAHDRGNGACNGDSGGPAVYNGEVIGIAGFVYSACGTSYPDGYAKVFSHVDWIKRHSNLS